MALFAAAVLSSAGQAAAQGQSAPAGTTVQTAAMAAPPGVVNPCAGKEIFYFFRYNDSDTVGVDKGCATKNDVTRSVNPALIATLLHVSCSDQIDPVTGIPTKSDLGDPNRRVAAYYIEKDGGKKTCGFGNPSGPPTVDVGILKTASASTVPAGGSATYTLTVSNRSDTTATGVVVSDVLPAGVQFTSASAGCTYNSATRKVTCNVGTLAVAGPPTNNCTGKTIFYRWEYNDSAAVGVDTGCAASNNVTRAENPALVATSLHVSCSDTISPDGVPTKSDLGDPNRRVKAYFIQKSDGKTCGQGTFTPPAPVSFTITVTVNASHCNTATVTSTEVDNNQGNNSSQVCITVPGPRQTIQAEIYLCVNGSPSATLISGGSITVAAAGLSSPNPLAPTGVPAGTYTVNASAPSGLTFVPCGQTGVNIPGPLRANQQVTVPVGGAGEGKFYVTTGSSTQTIQGEIFLCVNGAPSTTLVSGGTLSFSYEVGSVSSANPLRPFNVPAGSYSLRADAPSGVEFVACGQGGVTIDNPGTARQTVVVPAGGAGDGKFYVQAVRYGYVEVCKSSANGVTGTFRFDLGGQQTVDVPAGACSPAIRVRAGTLKVTEAAAVGYTMAGAATVPASRLVSVQTGTRTATIKVVAGNVSAQTILTVTNKPVTGSVKVCQVAGNGVAVGTLYSFTNSANSQVAEVPAGPGPGGYCVLLNGTFSGRVTVTQSSSSSSVSQIGVSPANRLVSRNTTQRTATITVGKGVTEVTYTNTRP